MALDALNPSTCKGLLAQRIAMHLHVDKRVDERRYRGLTKRITCGDIDLVNILGQTVDNCLQQALVAKHNGCFATIVNAIGTQPLADIACLDILGRSRNQVNVVWWHLVGILIEDGLALLLQSAEECLFYLLQQVETNKHISIVFKL